MTSDRELMQMALDALEYVDSGVIKKDYLEVTIKALRDRLAQWRVRGKTNESIYCF
jgi:hypothetical protein